nr:MAG TPA: hypothetical protein [Caudoviricetes sp.]
MLQHRFNLKILSDFRLHITLILTDYVVAFKILKVSQQFKRIHSLYCYRKRTLLISVQWC